MKSVLPPSVGGVGLAEYVCTHPCLIFTEEDPEFIPEDVNRGSVLHPTLPVVRVTAGSFVWRKTLMTSIWFMFLFGF